MYKCNKLSIILLLQFIQIYNAPDTENFEPVYYEPIVEEIAEKSLDNIQPHEVLPLIIFLDDITRDFEPPQHLDEVYLDKGRLTNGTKFIPPDTAEQMFFCPKENSDEKCLVAQEFHHAEVLQCKEEAEPVVRGEKEVEWTKCGLNDVGTIYSMVYEICSKPEPDDYLTKEIPFYSFCYDTTERKTLFTNHGIISPDLLQSKALLPERNVQYSMTKIDEFTPSNYEALKAAMTEEDPNLPNKIKTQGYKVQHLVPPEDMPFALWRKSTYQYFNVELQHENLIDLWNDINLYIRNDAIKNWFRYCISTGVFELSSKSREDDQLSNVWVKIVYKLSVTPWEAPANAVAILMDNFINSTDDRQVDSDYPTTSASSNKLDYDKDEYCEKNLCIDGLKEKFKNTGGRVRCCSLTGEMRKLFGMEDITSIIPILSIPGIISNTESN